jgi:hypothetical protein
MPQVLATLGQSIYVELVHRHVRSDAAATGPSRHGRRFEDVLIQICRAAGKLS